MEAHELPFHVDMDESMLAQINVDSWNFVVNLPFWRPPLDCIPGCKCTLLLVFFISCWHCQSLGHLREKACILPHLTGLCILHIQVWNRIFFASRVLEHSNCAHCNQVVMLMALPSQEPWSFSSGGGHGNVVVAGTNSQERSADLCDSGYTVGCCTTLNCCYCSLRATWWMLLAAPKFVTTSPQLHHTYLMTLDLCCAIYSGILCSLENCHQLLEMK
ncbi:hypothetical protein CY35_08G123600 [Sphagnum magellanicum]|nr:hypothetical protein CY35_08G123600 [Sphagnum magellanicum]